MAVKNSLLNMVLSLVGITFICSVSVAVVNQVTIDPIKEANEKAVESALQAVLPSFDKLENKQVEEGGFMLDIYTAYSGDEVVGYAAKTSSLSGYAGLIELIMGVSPSGELLNIQVVKQSETPGLGAKILDEDNNLITSLKGEDLNTYDLRVAKDGGEVDALTGSTITSRAYLEAVKLGFEVLKSNIME